MRKKDRQGETKLLVALKLNPRGGVRQGRGLCQRAVSLDERVKSRTRLETVDKEKSKEELMKGKRELRL